MHVTLTACKQRVHSKLVFKTYAPIRRHCVIDLGNCPSGTWSFIVKHTALTHNRQQFQAISDLVDGVRAAAKVGGDTARHLMNHYLKGKSWHCYVITLHLSLRAMYLSRQTVRHLMNHYLKVKSGHYYVITLHLSLRAMYCSRQTVRHLMEYYLKCKSGHCYVITLHLSLRAMYFSRQTVRYLMKYYLKGKSPDTVALRSTYRSSLYIDVLNNTIDRR